MKILACVALGAFCNYLGFPLWLSIAIGVVFILVTPEF